MAVDVKIGEIYKYSYDFGSEVYVWDFDRSNNCGIWLGSYQHPANSLVLILEIFFLSVTGPPILKVLIDGKVRYFDCAPEVVLVKI